MTYRPKLLVAFGALTIALTLLNWVCQLAVLGATLNVDAPEESANRTLALTEQLAFVTGLPLSLLLGDAATRGTWFGAGFLNALLVSGAIVGSYSLMQRSRLKTTSADEP